MNGKLTGYVILWWRAEECQHCNNFIWACSDINKSLQHFYWRNCSPVHLSLLIANWPHEKHDLSSVLQHCTPNSSPPTSKSSEVCHFHHFLHGSVVADWIIPHTVVNPRFAIHLIISCRFLIWSADFSKCKSQACDNVKVTGAICTVLLSHKSEHCWQNLVSFAFH